MAGANLHPITGPSSIGQAFQWSSEDWAHLKVSDHSASLLLYMSMSLAPSTNRFLQKLGKSDRTVWGERSVTGGWILKSWLCHGTHISCEHMHCSCNQRRPPLPLPHSSFLLLPSPSPSLLLLLGGGFYRYNRWLECFPVPATKWGGSLSFASQALTHPSGPLL